MICPYCDSRIGVLPDNRSCPLCGAPLGAAAQKKPQFPEPPLGKYKQTFGYMEIQERGVKFYEKFLLSDKVNRIVPYDEIIEVAYRPAVANSQMGFLCVRGWQDRYLPIAKTYSEACDDSTAVVFGYRENRKYYQVYEFLKKCADIANAARELQGESRL